LVNKHLSIKELINSVQVLDWDEDSLELFENRSRAEEEAQLIEEMNEELDKLYY